MEPIVNKISKVETLLKVTYGLVPIVAGADKFTNLLVNWADYLNPITAKIIPASTFMPIVGIVEIIAGIIVLAKPKIGAFIVSAWLVLIAINLVVCGKYYDIAVRDLVMAIGAFSLGIISNILCKHNGQP